MNLKGILPDRAVQAFDALSKSLTSLTTQFNSLSAKPLLTKTQADIAYGPAAQRKALQVSGTDPLNVAGLIGVLSQPQLATVAKLTAAPTAGANAQPGTIVTINNVINQVISPGVVQALSAIGVFLSDTHANRVANYPPANYAAGTGFFESDTLLLLESTGTIWQTIAGTINGTHAARLASWPSVQFSSNTSFRESDRLARYLVQDATGTVNTAGTAVTWVSGNHFINTGSGFTAAQWPAGTVITINGVGYPISAVGSSTALTLSGAGAGAQAGVAYTVTAGRWVYDSGEYFTALVNLPADLGENDTVLVSSKVQAGFLFYENALYFHQLQWNVSVWQRGPHDIEHSDTFHDFGAAPTDPGWHICDGSAGVAFLKYNGTTGTRTLPDLTTAAYAQSTKATYTPGLTAPTLPTFTGALVTPAGTNSAPTFTGTVSGSIGVLAGAVNVVPAPYAPAGTVSAPVFTGTPLTPTGTIALPGDPVENFSLIKYYRT